MSDLISVIVPVYNSDPYIIGCVESVLAQTYTCFELLLVDDGSKAPCRDLCEKLSRSDKRVRVISQKHHGVSAARNTGMEASKGSYFFFLDADDIIHPQLLEALYRLVQEKRAAIASESRYYAPGGAFRKPEEWEIEADIRQDGVYLDCEKAIWSLIYGEREATLYVIGGKMISREAIKGIRFDERLTHGEDTLFLYCLFEEGADAVVLHRNWYYYRIHDCGATRIFTVAACQSRYEAERYIRDKETEYGRLANAIHWEEANVRAMAAWYEAGRSGRDKSLIKYVRNLAKAEKQQKIFSQISRYEKAKIYLLSYCPFFYHVLYLLKSGMPACPRLRGRMWRMLHRRG